MVDGDGFFKAIIVFWIAAVLLSLTVTGVSIWAIIKLVLHFTA